MTIVAIKSVALYSFYSLVTIGYHSSLQICTRSKCLRSMPFSTS